MTHTFTKFIVLGFLLISFQCDKSKPKPVAPEIPAAEIQELVNELGTESKSDQMKAALKLKEVGDRALPFLLKALDNEDGRIRAGALMAINFRKKKTPKHIVNKALSKMDDPWPSARGLSTWTLRSFKKSGSTIESIEQRLETVRHLCLKDPDEHVRGGACSALGYFPQHIDTTLPVLIEVLNTRKTQDVYMAASAMEGLGPFAKQALPALKAALKRKDICDGYELCLSIFVNNAIEAIEK